MSAIQPLRELQSTLSSLYTQDGVLIWILQGTQNRTTEIEAETIMAGITIRMEVDLTNSFNHLSLTALLSDLLRSFQKKILWISVFIVCPLQSQVRLWVRLVSTVTVNKTRRTRAVYQVVKDYSRGSVKVFWNEIHIYLILIIFFSE